MKKLISFSTIFISLFFIFPIRSYAVCPVCTIAVGAGLGLSRFLGIDDAVSGLWLGGLVISSSLWLTNWIMGKYKPKIKEFYLKTVSVTLTTLFVFIPLNFAKVIGHPYNTILGIDKLIVGSILGALIFLFSIYADNKVREIKGKQLFNYQKIVFPISLLAIASLIMYFLTK